MLFHIHVVTQVKCNSIVMGKGVCSFQVVPKKWFNNGCLSLECTSS